VTEAAPLIGERPPRAIIPLRVEGIMATKVAFGPEVAMYFVFMRSFTLWLLPPAFIGFFMWLLRPAGVTVDDSKVIPFFSLFMVLWASAFPSIVQHEESKFACEWGCLGAERREVSRVEFVGHWAISPITEKMELCYPAWKRWLKYAASTLVTLVMLAVAFAVMICSLNLQGYVHAADELGAEGLETRASPFHIEALASLAEPGRLFDPSGAGDPWLGGWITYVPVLMHVLVIRILNRTYCGIAEGLTAWENHRTERGHEDALIVKRFLFEAFDSYVALFYVAFFMRDPLRLRQELVSLYTIDSLRRAATELLLPWLSRSVSMARARRSSATVKKGDLPVSDWEEIEDSWDRVEYDSFDDYLEMVLGFGYVVLFAGAMPLASALAVLSNVAEVHSDAFKLHFVSRRPAPHRTSSMPRSWFLVIRVMCCLCILTNFLICYVSSEQIEQLAPSLFTSGERPHSLNERGVWCLLASEHLVVLLALAVHNITPSTAKWVCDAVSGRKYRRHLSHERNIRLSRLLS